MQSIRVRLAVWFAVATVSTVAVFAVIGAVATRVVSQADVDQQISAQADLAAVLISETILGEAVEDPRTRQPSDISTFLDRIYHFVIVVNPEGQLIYVSPRIDDLDPTAAETLRRAAFPLPEDRVFGSVALGTPRRSARFVARRVRAQGLDFGAVVVAEYLGLSIAANRNLIAVLAVVTLFVTVALSGVIGYALASRALRPLTAMIDEVEAITDGRTLHRRLPTPRDMDEVGRMATTLNAMLSRLEQSFAVLRRFTADASHELKTPLTVLRAGVERALTTAEIPPETLVVLEETLLEINRTTDLVEALLTLARADEGRAPLDREPLDLRAVLDDVTETAGILAERANVELEVTRPAGPVEIRGDRGRLRQLLLNLLENAFKYTARGGKVSLGLSDKGHHAELTVGDTGIGIAPGDLPHVFDRFWRADTARTRTVGGGSGLGLAISKWIVEAHGGTITVGSRPRRGTTFRIRLPKEESLV